MGIKTIKIVRDLPLSEYDEGMNGFKVHVWVNPTRDYMRQYDVLTKAQLEKGVASDAVIDQQTAEWFSVMFSQGTDDAERLSAEDLAQLYEQDPALWLFITSRYWEMVNDHLMRLEKKQPTL
jgi:hypothetical protein